MNARKCSKDAGLGKPSLSHSVTRHGDGKVGLMDSELNSKPEEETKLGADSELNSEAEAKSLAELDSELKSQAEAKLLVELDSELKSRPEEETKLGADSELKSEAEAKSLAELDSELKSKPEATLGKCSGGQEHLRSWSRVANSSRSTPTFLQRPTPGIR